VKYLLTLLIIITTNSIASESKFSKLPTENLNFEIVNNHTPETLVKDPFESTEEFNKRKEKLPKSKPINIYIKKSLSYDADKEEYSFRCNTDYNKYYTTLKLKDDTTLIPRSGINGFGAEWEWSEKSGRIYELRYECPKNDSFKVPLIEAKEFRDDFIAVFELELTAQNWDSYSKYESSEFGKVIVNRYSINFKNATLNKIHYGRKSSGTLYKTVSSSYKNVVINTPKEITQSLTSLPLECINNSSLLEQQEQMLQIEPIIRVEPKYPVQPARDGKTGCVTLKFTVDKVGGVKDIKIIKSVPMTKGGLFSSPTGIFDRAAKNAVKNWRYTPYVEDGKLKEYEQIVQLNFQLNN
jgi:TonB family protein